MAIRLVGAQRVLPREGGDLDEMMSFYSGFFGRAGEIEHARLPKRVMRFSSRVGDDKELHFIGLEVERIDDLPEGMVAWELGDTKRTVWAQSDEQPAGQDEIRWLWRSDDARPTGEFALVRIGCEVGLSANAYLAPPGAAADDDVALVDYDPSWPQKFAAFAQWLRESLGDVVLQIEHIGSTAIPGMATKPIIDIAVEVPSFAEAKRRVIPLLNDQLWEYWWYDGHMTFIKRAVSGQRTHHVHMAPAGQELWDGLAFRDYLRSYPEDAVRYAALKRELAERFSGDRERYTEAKSAFVREVTDRAVLAADPHRCVQIE